MKTALLALAAALPLVAPARIVRHRSFSRGLPVTPSSSPNATAYPIGTGMIVRDATPAFDFLSGGRFAIANVHFGDTERDFAAAARKAGAATVEKRALEDGSTLITMRGGASGILVGRTGPQGGARTEYRVGSVSAVMKGGGAIAISAEFASAEEEPLAKFRDWASGVFSRRATAEGPAIDVIPKAGFGASADKSRSRAWRDSVYRYELRYDSGPARLTVTAARPGYFRAR